MFDLRLAVLICVLVDIADSQTCDTCTTTYETAHTNAGSDNAAKCTALKTYLTCLEPASGAGCPLIASKAAQINTNFMAISSACMLTAACTCQKDYWKTDVSSGSADECTAAKARITCLKDASDMACDGTSTVASLGATTKNIVDAITGPACTLTGACSCQLDHVRADVSSDANNCTAAKNYISCLVGKNDAGCDGSVIVKTLADSANAIISGISTCTQTAVCMCEIAYATADISDNDKRCAETKTLTTCSGTSIANGCGASTTKTTVGTAAQTVFTALTSTNCPLTPTCQCQVDFNKADVTASAKCNSANALITCLNNITATNDTACDGTTVTSALKTNVTTTVRNVLCSTAAVSASVLLVSIMLLFVEAVTTLGIQG